MALLGLCPASFNPGDWFRLFEGELMPKSTVGLVSATEVPQAYKAGWLFVLLKGKCKVMTFSRNTSILRHSTDTFEAGAVLWVPKEVCWNTAGEGQCGAEGIS